MRLDNIVIRHEDGIGIIAINRPEVRNALNNHTIKELEYALERFELDDEVNIIVLTGEGDEAFVAGADIRQLREKQSLDALLPSLSTTCRLIENARKVTIAAINGYALGGGCELAMACDIRIAAEHAKLGLPELNLAIIPGAGGTQRLARIVGKGHALHLILTGEIITARKAEAIGLVSEVVPKEELWQTVRAKAEKIRSKGPLAVQLAKLTVNRGFDLDLDSALMMERLAQAILFGSQDKDEGTQAFLEKRKPQYTGR